MFIITWQIIIAVLKIIGVIKCSWMIVLIPTWVYLVIVGINLTPYALEMMKDVLESKMDREKYRHNGMKDQISELEEAFLLDCSPSDLDEFEEAKITARYLDELKRKEKKAFKKLEKYYKYGKIVWEPSWLKRQEKKRKERW